MSVHVTSAVWKAEGLSPTAKLILLKLADNANDQWVAWPSQATISRETGISRSAVNDNLRKLASGGWIERVSGGPNRSTKYVLQKARLCPAERGSPADGVPRQKDKGTPPPGQGTPPAGHEPSLTINEPSISLLRAREAVDAVAKLFGCQPIHFATDIVAAISNNAEALLSIDLELVARAGAISAGGRYSKPSCLSDPVVFSATNPLSVESKARAWIEETSNTASKNDNDYRRRRASGTVGTSNDRPRLPEEQRGIAIIRGEA